MRIIPGETVAELLTVERAIELMEGALVAAVAPDAVQPPRWMIPLGSNAVLGVMPGMIARPPALGAKVTAVMPPLRRDGLPSHQGIVALFDPRTGALRAVLDGNEITARRTAAVSAVATRHLARVVARSLLVVGTGDQARAHLAALGAAGQFTRLFVWGRDPAQSRALAQSWNAAHRVPLEVVEDLAAAVGNADVVCTVTAARQPIVRGAWVKPGTHLNLVGSSDPGAAEVDDDLVARCRLFVDRRDAVEALSGEWRNALAAGRVDASHIVADLGDVIAGRDPGRRGPEEITVFKSVGLNAEDLVAAEWVAAQAERLGLGTEVRM